MKIIKRNGSEVDFDLDKIFIAIKKASDTCPIIEQRLSDDKINEIAKTVEKRISDGGRCVSVEEIQDLVENEIFKTGSIELGKKYVKYRFTRQLARKANSTDNVILSLLDADNEVLKQENANKNPIITSVQRDYMAGEVSKDLTRRILAPEDIMKAHDEGIIHFHDTDYFAQRMYNCCLINLEDMLQNGTVISNTMIEKPRSFTVACTVATQIISQVASNQYGGQTISLAHLAPFVDVSRRKIRRKVESEVIENLSTYDIPRSEKQNIIERITDSRLQDEIKQGIQTIQYQIITLMTTNGQAPFITLFMYLNEVEDPQTKADLALLIEEVLKQRMQGVRNEVGEWITPAFPKLIYVTEEDNIKEDSPYWYLTVLAAKCSAKRMVPDYISEKVMKTMKVDQKGIGRCYPNMGCRSFLTPYLTPDGEPKYYGRFNQGVVTINLPDVALASHKNKEKFWKIFDERLELCHKALKVRHERLEGTKSDVAPILWQYGAIARLKKGETIDKLLHGGYSTISLGYAGLYECVKYMTGKSHTDSEAKPFAIEVMQHMNDKTAEWKKAEGIDYSLYGTPKSSRVA